MLVGVVLSLGRRASSSAILSNRLKGPYFALSTIAFSQVLLIVASRWRGFTSGREGIPVPFRPGFATLGLGHVAWVYMALAAALLYFGIEVYLERSRVGYRSPACARTRTRRRRSGIPTRRLKVVAVALSAALTSVCGTLWAQYVGLRRSVLRLLGRPLRPLRAQRHHRRHRHGARALPRLDPHHVARDLSARDLLRREDRLHRHLPDHLRRRAHPGRALRARGSGRHRVAARARAREREPASLCSSSRA